MEFPPQCSPRSSGPNLRLCTPDPRETRLPSLDWHPSSPRGATYTATVPVFCLDVMQGEMGRQDQTPTHWSSSRPKKERCVLESCKGRTKTPPHAGTPGGARTMHVLLLPNIRRTAVPRRSATKPRFAVPCPFRRWLVTFRRRCLENFLEIIHSLTPLAILAGFRTEYTVHRPLSRNQVSAEEHAWPNMLTF